MKRVCGVVEKTVKVEFFGRVICVYVFASFLDVVCGVFYGPLE